LFQFGGISDDASFLNCVFRHCREEKGQVDFEALEQLENPDHHATSMQAMKLYCKVKDMLEMLDCPLPISFKDLLRPESSRTEFFISALLNYGLYKYVLHALSSSL